MTSVWCSDCGRKLSSKEPRVVLEGRWFCGECLYYKERGEQNPRKKRA